MSNEKLGDSTLIQNYRTKMIGESSVVKTQACNEVVM